MEEKQWKGMALAILGALFWGLSGTSVQFLENAKHINVEWLLEARLLIAGILTIGLAYIRDGKRIFSIFTEPKDIGKLLVFGIFRYCFISVLILQGHCHFRSRYCYGPSICCAYADHHLFVFEIL